MPLVTIGIPTYNRPESLERAVRSALSQSHRELVVLVSDDASTDARVAEVLSRLSAEDSRVRATRQPRNLGHAANYQCVLDAAETEYFMWLADDDWIEAAYIARCLDHLRTEPGLSSVCGLARYYADGAHAFDERPTNLISERAAWRVLRYFARVSLNGPLFGVARREQLRQIGFPQHVGGDWLLVASLAAEGRMKTLSDVHIHRSLAGLGASAQELAHSFGMHGLAARQHHGWVAFITVREIARGSGAFRAIPAVPRLGTALGAGFLIVLRFTLAGLIRRVLGVRIAAALERRISAWLRARDGATR